MTFEEQFPSLKGKAVEPLRCRKIKYVEDDDLCEAGNLDYQKDFSLRTRETEEFRVFSMDDIQENCLDKQKVKEAIDNWIKSDVDIETHGVLMRLKEELKL